MIVMFYDNVDQARRHNTGLLYRTT